MRQERQPPGQKRPHRISVLVCAAAVAIAAAAAAAGDDPATRVIDELHATYTSVLRQSAALDYGARYARLDPAIAEAFDLQFMSRAVIGRRWRKLAPEEQQRWTRTFAQFTVANYAARLDHDNGQVFEVTGKEPAENETVMILTRVVEAGAEPVILNYRMRETPSGWKIIDVYAKGTVSELALRRGEYAPLLKNKGIEALVASIESKVEELATGKKPD
jgi:phospholipid transport system substrate-binding protein